MNDLAGATILLLLFLGVIGTAETLKRRNKIEAEAARKSIHLAGGLGCLLFPFLVTSWVTVLALALFFGATFYFGENRGLLQSLASVERKSSGSLLFPVAVLILFVVSEGRIWLYVSALLVLVLADSAAALAGVRFGRIFYETAPGESKSLEGTLAFCAVGFLAVFIPLATLSDLPIITCALTAVLMAFLLAALEAVSVGGTDNLFVPLGTVYLLLMIPSKPWIEIMYQCISLLCISIVIFSINRRFDTLRMRPMILFLLTAYSAWSLGSAEWMIPVIVGFIFYNWVCTHCRPLPNLSASELLRPLFPTLGLLFLANTTREFNFWFTPFTVATSTATSLCIVNRFRNEESPTRLSGKPLIMAAALPITVSLLLFLPFRMEDIFHTLTIALPLCGVITMAYNRLIPTTLCPFTWNYAIPIFSSIAAIAYSILQATTTAPVLEPSTWAEVFR